MVRKIVFPHTGILVGGSVVSEAMIIKELQKKSDWDVVVLLPNIGPNTQVFEEAGVQPNYYWMEPSQIEVIRHTSRISNKIRAVPTYYNIYKKAQRYLAKIQPDIVHINDDRSIFTWGLASKRLKIPVIWHVRQENGNAQLDIVRLKIADFLIFNSEGSRLRFEKHKTKLPVNCVIYNSIDTKKFAPPSNKIRQKQLMGFNTSSITIGFVANLMPRKRLEWLLRFLINMDKENRDYQLIVVGNDYSEGRYISLINETKMNLSNPDKLLYLGYRSDISEIMKSLDVLAVPSTRESFGRIYAEAMACGVPVVGCDVGGVPEVINDSVTGHLVPVNDYDRFETVLKALCQNDEVRVRMGKAGIKHVERNFSPAIVFRKLELVYEKLWELKEDRTK